MDTGSGLENTKIMNKTKFHTYTQDSDTMKNGIFCSASSRKKGAIPIHLVSKYHEEGTQVCFRVPWLLLVYSLWKIHSRFHLMFRGMRPLDLEHIVILSGS